MQRLNTVFSECRSSQRPAFIPFLTAGDPSLAATGELVETLVDAGADVIEIGFPYSDPLADGPVIQASYTRSLAAGTKLTDLFTAAAQWTARFQNTPFLAMASYSLIYRRGTEAFLEASRHAGFAGVVIPDLPHEEGEALVDQASARGLALIRLVTRTTPPDRAAAIAKVTTGFLYVVSVTGITGTRATLPTGLTDHLAQLRSLTSLPLCVGFGISTPDQAAALTGHADGVIVGSAIVRCLEGDHGLERKKGRVGDVARSLRGAL